MTRRIFAMGLILCVLGWLAACHSRAAVRGAGYTDDYEIALILTDTRSYSTFIEYYDDELELVNALQYPYSSMENSWGEPMCYGNAMYIIPQGLGYKLDARLVIGLAPDKCRLLVLGEDLRLRQTIGIDGYSGIYSSDLIGDNLYFQATREDSFSETGWGHGLFVFSWKDRQTRQVLESDFLIKSVVAADDYLYALQFDPNIDEADKLIILDKETGAYINEYPLSYRPQFAYCKGGALYVTGTINRTPDRVLAKYLPDGDTLAVSKEIGIGRQSHLTSGLFSTA
jgi:hypothetical protein